MYTTPFQFDNYSGSLFGDPTSNLISNLVWAILLILQVVGMALVFEKAGNKWWKALIPFYCEWTEVEIAQVPKSWFWILIGTLVGGIVVLVMGFISLVVAVAVGVTSFMGPNVGLMVLSFILLAVGFILLTAFLIVYTLILYHLARAFGKGLGFTIGLLLAPWVFWMILGLNSKMQYDPTRIPPSGPLAQESQKQAVLHQQTAFGQAQASTQTQVSPHGQTFYPPAVAGNPYGQTLTGQGHTAYGQPSQSGQVGQQAYNQQVSAAPENPDSGRLSKGAVIGFVLLIIVPLLACCILGSYALELAGQANPGEFTW